MPFDKECIFKSILGSWYDNGFKLAEIDDDFVKLTFKDKDVGVYNQCKVTPETLQRDCKNFWNEQLNIYTGAFNDR